MHNNLISVVIPVYNVEEYLEECLDSVLAQTYENIEIIAINDGSTDASLKILKKYELKDKNITVISQRNQGQSVARNKGIEIASGKYICFLDSDDYISPEAFENIIAKIEDNDLDLLLFGAEPFTDNLDIKINKNQYNFKYTYDENKIYKKEDFLKLNLQAFHGSSVLFVIKKDLLIENKIMFKPGIIHEDVLFTLEVYLNTNKMMYDPNLYYKRRYRPNSTITTVSFKQKKKSFDSQCDIINELSVLLQRYTEENEIKLIKRIMRVTTIKLFSNYQEIGNSYRKKKIKSLKKISVIQYYYWSFRGKIRSIFKKID